MNPTPGMFPPPSRKLSLARRIALKLLKWLIPTLNRGLQWLARGTFDQQPPAPPGSPTYVQSVGWINPLVLMRARDDMAAEMGADPEGQQAELNACMESIREESLKNGMLMMFGSLIAKGLPTDEAMVRVVANFLLMGMFLERRIVESDPHPVGRVLEFMRAG